MTSEIIEHLLGRSDNLCKGGALVHHQTYSSKKIDKKGQNEKTCALACLKETAAVETSSFILRFWVFLEHHFAIFFFFFSYDWFPDSLVLIQVSQRGENISLWVPVLCKSEPEYTPWDMSALRLVNSRLWKPLVCISPLIRETHTSSSRWASTLLGFPWKQGEWTDPLWADTKVSFYTNRIEICRWSVLVEANAKKQLAKKQTKKKIKQQSNWMRLRNKQKKKPWSPEMSTPVSTRWQESVYRFDIWERLSLKHETQWWWQLRQGTETKVASLTRWTEQAGSALRRWNEWNSNHRKK